MKIVRSLVLRDMTPLPAQTQVAQTYPQFNVGAMRERS